MPGMLVTLLRDSLRWRVAYIHSLQEVHQVSMVASRATRSNQVLACSRVHAYRFKWAAFKSES